MKRFKVNGKEYVAKELDFNAMCDLEEMGVDVTNAGKAPMSMIRGYLAFCGNMSAEDAGKEMNAHIISGNKFDDIMVAMQEQMDNSDFFRSLNKKKEEKTTENQTK